VGHRARRRSGDSSFSVLLSSSLISLLSIEKTALQILISTTAPPHTVVELDHPLPKKGRNRFCFVQTDQYSGYGVWKIFIIKFQWYGVTPVFFCARKGGGQSRARDVDRRIVRRADGFSVKSKGLRTTTRIAAPRRLPPPPPSLGWPVYKLYTAPSHEVFARTTRRIPARPPPLPLHDRFNALDPSKGSTLFSLQGR
jgi:hypothetical protein